MLRIDHADGRYSIPCEIFMGWLCGLLIIITCKGSAWVPAYAGTHASGKAGQHFSLFDSILSRVRKLHTFILCMYSMYGNAKRLIETDSHNNVLL